MVSTPSNRAKNLHRYFFDGKFLGLNQGLFSPHKDIILRAMYIFDFLLFGTSIGESITHVTRFLAILSNISCDSHLDESFGKKYPFYINKSYLLLNSVIIVAELNIDLPFCLKALNDTNQHKSTQNFEN